MADVIPIIIIGKREKVGQPIIDGLKPQVEGESKVGERSKETSMLTTAKLHVVVHFILDEAASLVEIPYVVKGQKPPTQSSSIGSGDYASKKPLAVVAGGGYDSKFAAAIVEAIKDYPVLVFEVDESKQKDMPPLFGPDYGPRMVERVKEALLRARDEGRLGDGKGGILLY
jgi:hypothetical protein